MLNTLFQNHVRNRADTIPFNKEYYNFYFRRQEKRRPYSTPVMFSVDSKIYTETMEDISHGGACVTTNENVGIAAGKSIIIIIPFQHKEGAVKLKAYVKWSDKDKFGIEFAR